MSKNILVISASLRNGSNSDMLLMNLCAERWKAAIKQKKLPCAAKTLIFAKAALPARKQANALLTTIWQKFCPKCSRQMLSVLLRLCIFMICAGSLKHF